MTALPDFDELWDYDHPDETEAKFRELLTGARESRDAHYLAELLTQIARTEGLQRKSDEAHATLDEAEQLLATEQGGQRARVRLALERGRVFNSARLPDRARPLFLEAWEAANADLAHIAFFAADAAHMLGIIEPPEAAMEWNLRAVAVAEGNADGRARKWLGSLYNNIGWTYHDQRKDAEALDMFERALKLREERGQPPQIRFARWSVARCLRSLGRVEEALAIQQTLLAEHETIGEKSGYVFEELGECLLLLNRADEARLYFGLAHDELAKDPGLAENEPARLERLIALAKNR